MFDVVVMGGGPTGVTAALRARELGAEVALVERGRLGGTCTNDGCVPTRVLARAARLKRDSEQFEHYGLDGGKAKVDFARLLARTQQVVYQMHEKKQLDEHLRQIGVKVYANAGAARLSDEHTILLASGEGLQADKIVICVGGHARRFPFPGGELALTHHDVWSLTRLPASVAIVGGAATGSQLASIFAAFGTKISLLEVGPAILSREDGLVSKVMTEAFRQRGIEIITGIGGVERIEKAGKALQLWYTREEQSHALQVEAVVLAVGWAGNVEELNLEAAGVQTERSYVVVDDYLRTSVPHIFAAGDITGRMMLVQSGSYEGRIAAENAVLGAGQPYAHIIVPHGGFTDPEYASVGLTEAEARAQQDCVVAVVPFVDVDRAVIDGHTEGCCKLIVSQETHRILGAHVVGEQALEIVHLAAAGMASGMWVEQLAEMELAYPTYTAVIGLAARRIVRELGVVPLAAQWRSLGKEHGAEWEQRHT